MTSHLFNSLNAQVCIPKCLSGFAHIYICTPFKHLLVHRFSLPSPYFSLRFIYWGNQITYMWYLLWSRFCWWLPQNKVYLVCSSGLYVSTYPSPGSFWHDNLKADVFVRRHVWLDVSLFVKLVLIGVLYSVALNFLRYPGIPVLFCFLYESVEIL